jgi:hypothetical protein
VLIVAAEGVARSARTQISDRCTSTYLHSAFKTTSCCLTWWSCTTLESRFVRQTDGRTKWLEEERQIIVYQDTTYNLALSILACAVRIELHS